MTEVKPFIRCVDYWPMRLTPEILAAYEAMIKAGQIRKHTVIYNKAAGSTTVEYYATVPQEWMREGLKDLVRQELQKEG